MTEQRRLFGDYPADEAARERVRKSLADFKERMDPKMPPLPSLLDETRPAWINKQIRDEYARIGHPLVLCGSMLVSPELAAQTMPSVAEALERDRRRKLSTTPRDAQTEERGEDDEAKNRYLGS